MPEGSLIKIINELKENSTYTHFMFNQFRATNHQLNCEDSTTLSIEEFAIKNFYYIGNAGVFAISVKLLNELFQKNDLKLNDTCWPQTEMFFLTLLNSENKNVLVSNVCSAIANTESYIYYNSFYLFETLLYSLLRLSIKLNKALPGFISLSYKSIPGVCNYDWIYREIIEKFYFVDSYDEKDSLLNLLDSIDENNLFNFKELIKLKQALLLNDYLGKLYTYLYYARFVWKTDTSNNLIKKLYRVSPVCFFKLINKRIKERESYIFFKRNSIVTNNSGYF
jgi:hypothetical protein